MKQEWKYIKLSDVCHITSGYTPKSNELLSNGDIPYFKVADMNTIGNEVYLDNTQQYKNAPCKTFAKGSVVFPKNGAAIATNKKRVLKYDSIVDLNTGVATFSNKVNNLFGYYWFKNIDFKSFTRGGALPTLDVKTLKDSTFPLPSLEEQTYIVSELDKINELIRLKKEQLKDYDNLAQSIFYEMFGDPVVNEKGWEVKKLREVCECITDGDHMPPPKSDKGVPFVTIGNINKETRQIEFDKTFFVPKDYFDNIPYTKKPKKGDVLYTVTGSYGIPLLIAYDKEFCFQRHIGLLRPNGLVNSIYLYMWASNKSVKGQADVVATGIAQKTVSLNSLRGFNITLPPLPLQQLFAQRIELIEKQKAEVQQTIKILETLLASRMQYWFD